MTGKIPLLLLLVLVILISGCTGIPPQLCIIPGLCDGGGTEYANDVIIIKSLEALPEKVSPGQQIKLRSYIQNLGNKPVNGIEVVLYDYCGNLFTVNQECPDGNGKLSSRKGCRISLLPHQTKPVEWVLVSDENTKLKTDCKLKIYAKYPYETDSITSVTFIDYKEYQKQLDEGTFRLITSYWTEGYGPIKPYLTVEDAQPIPVERGKEGSVTLGFQIKNKGNGFLSGGDNKIGIDGIIIERDGKCDFKGKEGICMRATSIKLGGSEYNIVSGSQNKGNSKYRNLKECIEKNKDSLVLIDRETPKMICPVPVPRDVNLPKESTIHVTTTVRYEYEFRKEVKVTVEPKV
ncbi:MAG TPA: hypothetical protein ENG00_00985 [Candidatus Aenigmarchaeota archaeon]|nr:hypothetical protein [Candidatus Aenigmarchaeota archaeon]